MNQLNQIGIGVVANNDFLKSHPDRETTVAGAVAVPEKYTPHEVNNALPKVKPRDVARNENRFLTLTDTG